MWIAYLISPSALSWITALLLVEKSITFNCTTMYLSLCILFPWFCFFDFASIPGGHSSSHEIPPVHYSFEHNSIPSPADTMICLATTKSVAINVFVQVSFLMISLGINPAVVWLDQRAGSLLVLFKHSSKLQSRIVG